MPMSEWDFKVLNLFIKNENLDITISKGWRNYSRHVQNRQVPVFDIKDRRSLSVLLKKIHALNAARAPEDRIIVRVAAGGRKDVDDEYSQSYSVHGAVDTDAMFRLTGEEFTAISRVGKSNSVVIGASVQVGEMSHHIYDHYQLVISV